MRRILTLMAMATLAGCEPDPLEVPVNEAMAVAQTESRFQVVKLATFKDELAYNDRRAIFSIKDLRTGKEYLGVTGIGINEVGSHTVGDDTERDER